MIKITTNSPEETEAIAAKIAHSLRGGETIELVSDLGGGKTTFVRGLARGAGSEDHVSSPTFTLSKVYKAPSFEILHFDFYRLPEAGVLEHELHEVKNADQVVLVVEWGEVVQHVLPDNRLIVKFITVDENTREIELDCPDELGYLVEKL